MEKYENKPFIVLGSDCDKFKTLEDNLSRILDELKIDEEIVHISDSALISIYGVMKTPGLVIKQKVVSIGKVPCNDELKEFIKKYYW